MCDARNESVALISRVVAERAVEPLFQPIVDLDTRRLVGAEALARGPAGSPLEFPDQLFEAAARVDLVPELDQLCAARAHEIAQAPGAVVPPLVFINKEPAGADRPLSEDLRLRLASISTYRYVLEFTERALAAHPSALLEVAARAHRTGGALALDDVGADRLSLAFLPLLEPEVVKLDMHLLRDPYCAHTIETTALVCGYAQRTGAMVIAEGIETEQDLQVARALGAGWGQGWLFARPGPLSAVRDWPVDPSARLRAPRPELYVPGASPFDMASARHRARTGDRHLLDGLTAHVLRQLPFAGPYGVVLGAYPDLATGHGWIPRLADAASTAALVGVSGPGPGLPAPSPIRTSITDGLSGVESEAALVIVDPHVTVALCTRRRHDDAIDFVLTFDPDEVHAVARTLLHRLGPQDLPG
ncbi:Phytochrome cph2 [Actinoplanes sp. SE50]|nr:Phytochrome-like protein cph2 [Actinoplanes sp. SE50/110]ATO82948.1 Phytochrome cph2 [Actinoplanes sp. SE50]SLM00356.1 Putative cyclic-di-GMP phosphodiesterase AdrB [Actinoplanes sp. SE50/110]